MNTPTHPEILDANDAAAFLKMRRARVVRLANAGLIPTVRLPDKQPRFLRTDLLAWVESQRQVGDQR